MADDRSTIEPHPRLGSEVLTAEGLGSLFCLRGCVQGRVGFPDGRAQTLEVWKEG